MPVSPSEPVGTALPALGVSDGTLVIVGLGNPHARYRDTPHNVGYRVVDRLVEEAGLSWEEQPEGLVCTVELEGAIIKLLKPDASINVSGPLVRRFLARIGLAADDCVIVHDDMDLDLGIVRVKRNGGDGGHKGVRSVISALGIHEVARIRVGVRCLSDVREAKEVVLENFSRAEQVALAPALERAEVAIRTLVKELSGRPGSSTRVHSFPTVSQQSRST